MTAELFHSLVLGWTLLALLLVPIQLFYTAPYGRHTRRGWGPLIDNKIGWVIMELISPLVFGYLFLTGSNEKTGPMWIIFGLWMAHYLHRSIIFPMQLRTTGKKMPVSIALSAAVFNVGNGFFNGYWLGTLSASYPTNWLLDPRFVVGLALWIIGLVINLRADYKLIGLRGPGQTGYVIPRGGLFEWISCPNHFGEIIEWIGFAILCWNLPALSFAVWTAANLIPRALAHHRWYRERFENYPAQRRAVLPGIL